MFNIIRLETLKRICSMFQIIIDEIPVLNLGAEYSETRAFGMMLKMVSSGEFGQHPSCELKGKKPTSNSGKFVTLAKFEPLNGPKFAFKF